MLKRIIALILGLGLSLLGLVALAGSASANPTGIMTKTEFANTCSQEDIDTTGHVVCLRTDTQSQVEDRCNCTSDVTSRWTGSGGADWKTVWYYTPFPENALMTYKLLSDGKWHAQYGVWKPDGTRA